MKKIILLVLLIVGTSFSKSSEKEPTRTTFTESVSNLKHEADTLNTLIKTYNEKRD